jgi:hypothetical protein
VTDARHGPYRRIATEEAFSVPEVYQAMGDWAGAAAADEPDQDFWRFVLTQDTPGLIFHENAERLFRIASCER